MTYFSSLFPVSTHRSVLPSPLSASRCQRSFLKVHVRNGGRRWRGGKSGRCYVSRCVCGCQRGTGALAVSENGRLNLGSADWPIRDCFHVARSSQFSQPFLTVRPSLSSLSAAVFTTTLSVSSTISSSSSSFFLPFNLFSLPHLPMVYFTFAPFLFSSTVLLF